MTQKKPLILVIDDDRTAVMMLEAYLSKWEYQVISTSSAKVAQDLVIKNNKELDAILLDRMMPEMNGIEFVNWINATDGILKPPIIMQTAADKPEQVKEGIDVGVFYYLTKPIVEEVLRSVIASAVKESEQRKLLSEEIGKFHTAFQLMESANYRFRTLSEAESLSCFIANNFPDPYKILPAIAELLVNAVEHGNCGISYEEKSKLIAENRWRQEVDIRSNLQENKNKVVELVFSRTDDKFFIKVSDQGNGFLWRKFMDLDPSRALDNHGRGIARANILLSSLEYNETGNQLIASVNIKKESDFKW